MINEYKNIQKLGILTKRRNRWRTKKRRIKKIKKRDKGEKGEETAIKKKQ